jgi:hypothetical protein
MHLVDIDGTLLDDNLPKVGGTSPLSLSLISLITPSKEWLRTVTPQERLSILQRPGWLDG